MTTKTKKNSSTKAVPESSLQEPMCIISKENLESVMKWLNSDDMAMPQNQVRQCQRLLLTAKLVEIKE